jgi:BirA family biotin operon repressor/biotin-[acetyl-CoA-carboxylase] ligase
MPSPLDPDRLLRETFVARVEHHPVLGSTNDRAKECAAARSGPMPLLIVADRQTAGRGRGSNRWWTGQGGLACSLLVDPRPFGVGEAQGPLVGLGAGLSVVQTVAPWLSQHPLGIHWPNDVIAAGRKLAGILVEVLPGNLHVIGIGLNTNSTIQEAPEEIRHSAVTLRDLTGTVYDPTAILRDLLRHLEAVLRRLGTAPAAIAAEADRLCLQRGRMLTLQWDRRTVSGRCLGIAPDGALVLETPAGKRAFYSGKVTHQGLGVGGCGLGKNQR